MKKLKKSLLNTDCFSVECKETPEGVIVDVWVRDGELIETFTFWNDDYFEQVGSEKK